jgi:hypothetical protein
MLVTFDLEKMVIMGRVQCFGGSSGSSSVSETADMVEQAKINTSLWNYYQNTYKPQVDQYISRATDPNVTAEEGRQVAGQIRGEAMKNVNPANASKNPVENAKRLSGLATAETAAQTAGQAKVRQRQIGELQNVIDIGRGQETKAQSGLGELAGQSLSGAIRETNLANERTAATENAIGSIAGALGAGAFRSLTVKPGTGSGIDENRTGMVS